MQHRRVDDFIGVDRCQSLDLLNWRRIKQRRRIQRHINGLPPLLAAIFTLTERLHDLKVGTTGSNHSRYLREMYPLTNRLSTLFNFNLLLYHRSRLTSDTDFSSFGLFLLVVLPKLLTVEVDLSFDLACDLGKLCEQLTAIGVACTSNHR